MTAEEIAWLAGFLEGEASFGAYNQTKGRPNLRVSVKTTDRDVIEKVANFMDTKCYRRADDRPRHTDCWETSANGLKAENVMLTILPWMGERRAEKIRACLAMPNLSHRPKC